MLSQPPQPVPTIGNSAKLYTVDRITELASERGGSLRVLDVGCGESKPYFAGLLRAHEGIEYVGVDPLKESCRRAEELLAGTRATIHCAPAYQMMGRLFDQPFDVVISLSVMEHVVQRQRHLSAIAECMRADSLALINYDAGHFVSPSGWKDRAKTVVGPLLAKVGIERYYQRFVREEDFRRMAEAAGLVITQALSFNTRLKAIHKIVPAEYRAEHVRRWLDYELWLNEIGVAYDDSRARLLFTRYFELRLA